MTPDERLRQLERRWAVSGDHDDRYALWREAVRQGRGCEFGVHDVDASAPKWVQGCWAVRCDMCRWHVPVHWVRGPVSVSVLLNGKLTITGFLDPIGVELGDLVGMGPDGTFAKADEPVGRVVAFVDSVTAEIELL